MSCHALLSVQFYNRYRQQQQTRKIRTFQQKTRKIHTFQQKKHEKYTRFNKKRQKLRNYKEKIDEKECPSK